MIATVDNLISEFVEVYNLPGPTELTQNTWSACLMYIRDHFFKVDGYRILMREDNRSIYDTEKLWQVLDRYIYLCQLYDKEVSVMGFTYLTGVKKDIIYQWASDSETYRHGYNKLNDAPYDFAKTLIEANEASLSNILVTGKRNAVAILGALNHRHAWNMPGVRNDGQNRALTAKELPKLGKVERLEVVEVVENSEKT